MAPERQGPSNRQIGEILMLQKQRLVAFGFVVVTALMFAVVGTNPLEAQQHPLAGCNTCFDRWTGGGVGEIEHWFQLDGCGEILNGGGEHPSHCSVCGFSSDCHELPEPGVCHLTCDIEPCNPHVDPGCDVNSLAFGEEPIASAEFVLRLAHTMDAIEIAGTDVTAATLEIANVAEAIRHVPGLSLSGSAATLGLVDCSGRPLARWDVPEHARGRLVAALASDD